MYSPVLYLSKIMAKKRRKKKGSAQVKETSPFVQLSIAAVIIFLGGFMLVGGFDTGGPLPINLFKGAYATFGRAAYLVPFALMYLGFYKFRDDNHKLPFARILSATAMSGAGSGIVFLTTATQDIGSQIWTGDKGGAIGGLVGSSIIGLLSKPLAIALLFGVMLFAAFYTLGISPKVLLRLIEMFKREERDEEEETEDNGKHKGFVTDLRALKDRIGSPNHNFQLNEGVPVEHSKQAHANSLKNTAQKLTAAEQHEALTTTNDPDWKSPGVDLLNQKQDKADAGDVNGNARIIEETFRNFNMDVEMMGANIGPRVTQYTLSPPSNVKLSKIVALDNNLALSLAAHSIRIEAPIPGQRAVGIEVPNYKSATVRLAGVMQSPEWKAASSPLTVAVGRDIAGKPILGDLEKMPHALIAGQTGSGKSVMINALLTSLLYRNSPSDLKLILVDPKQVEMAPYADIPHLLAPVITEPEKCISALKWAVAEMERRYTELAEQGKRNIEEYNKIKADDRMPYIVIVIDEMADLMMLAARDVEALVVRIAQKARAVGIHLVLATQRPSVDVITGLIKANIPARIAFTVSSQVDSRTIIDHIGAEKLLGMGDMLYQTADMPKPKRIQGALILDDETKRVCDFLRDQRPPQYDPEITAQPVQLNGRGGLVVDHDSGADDDMYKDAVRVVIEGGKASTSLLQRRLRVGYSRAARLIETMEEQGIVGPADGARPREVLVSSLDDVFNRSPSGAPMTDSSDIDDF